MERVFVTALEGISPIGNDWQQLVVVGSGLFALCQRMPNHFRLPKVGGQRMDKKSTPASAD